MRDEIRTIDPTVLCGALLDHLGVMIHANTIGGVAIQHIDLSADDLEPPDACVVSYADIPGAVDRQARNGLQRGVDPSLVPDSNHFPCVERPEDRSVEAAEVFLLVLRLADVLAVERNILGQCFRQLLLCESAGLDDAADLSEVSRIGFRHCLEAQIRGLRVVPPSRRGDERRTAAVLLQHRAMVCPSARVGQSPFRIGDEDRTSADSGVISIGSDALPC